MFTTFLLYFIYVANYIYSMPIAWNQSIIANFFSSTVY